MKDRRHVAKKAETSCKNNGATVLVCGTAAAILVCASLLLWLVSPGGVSGRSADTIGGPFSLTDDRGRAVTERSFPGKYLVVYFGYATCPDVCPATLNTLAASLDRLGNKADLVQPLFVTIDPVHDTPAVLHRYVSAFSPRIVGLSGTIDQMMKVADRYKVVRIVHHTAGTPGTTTLDHSSVLYVIAPDGKFIAPIPADASEMVMAQAIARDVS